MPRENDQTEAGSAKLSSTANFDSEVIEIKDSSEESDEFGDVAINKQNIQGLKLGKPDLNHAEEVVLNSSDWSSDDALNKNQTRKRKQRVISDDEEGQRGSKADKAGFAKGPGRPKKRALSSSSEDVDSDYVKKQKRTKVRRRRIQSVGEDSSSEESEDASPDKRAKGQIKDICQVSGDEHVAKVETEEALTVELERRKRMENKQKLFKEIFQVNEGDSLSRLVLDFDGESREVLVEVEPGLAKMLKPHQCWGIKFLWDAVFESSADVKAGRTPGGAILAHCMGLGKTLQTISLIHTVMSNFQWPDLATNFQKEIDTALVLCPVNVLKNWEDEFKKWLHGSLDVIDIYEMSGVTDNWERADRLRTWKRRGGVMIMGYDMFRNLANEDKKPGIKDDKEDFKRMKRIFKEALLDPGPKLVVCDEGHMLKNISSALNFCMNKIETPRRIILTGTPLQNCLSEYFAMVDFIKPSLLGTFKEFQNRFVNPIRNGQHSDSTQRDVQIMKKRSFILSDLLKGCMQRRDYNVLVPYLQPKHEYVLCINMTKYQKKLYKYYLENFARAGQIGHNGKLEGGKKGGLFYDVQYLSRIWNHPFILTMAQSLADEKKYFEDNGGEDDNMRFLLKEALNFIGPGEEDAESSNASKSTRSARPQHHSTRHSGGNQNLVAELKEAKQKEDRGWWFQFLDVPSNDVTNASSDNDLLQNIELGSKIVLLMRILKESERVGDKVLVFSQSLLSLDLIETFLERIDDLNGKKKVSCAFAGELERTFLSTWVHGEDYFRMDGSTSIERRKKWCSNFNRPSNTKMRLFLISTRAGGLGINLVAANRVIIFDASWNPAHDMQSIFRVFRFGQEKTVYIYRFLAKGTMEEKIYDRQVTKQSLSARVVDEQQIERHFTLNELAELYEFIDEPKDKRPKLMVPKDPIFVKLLKRHGDLIWRYHDHDTLLENRADEDLTEADRNLAWKEFESEETKGPHQKSTTISAAARVKSGELVTTATTPPAQDKRLGIKRKKSKQKCQKTRDSTSSSSSKPDEAEKGKAVSYQPLRKQIQCERNSTSDNSTSSGTDEEIKELRKANEEIKQKRLKMIKTTASTTKKNEQNSAQVVSGSSGADESVSQSQNKQNSTCSSGPEENEEETVSFQPFRRKK